MCAQHEDTGLGLSLRTKRKVNGHLVTIEVGVERRADEWVNLNGLALNKHRLEGLDTEAVKSWGAVQEHWVLHDHILEHIPHLRACALNHALCRLDVLRVLKVYKLLHYERLEEFECHLLWKSALAEFELRPGDNYGAA